MECGRMSDPSSWICGQMCECNKVIHTNVNTGAYNMCHCWVQHYKTDNLRLALANFTENESKISLWKDT